MTEITEPLSGWMVLPFTLEPTHPDTGQPEYTMLASAQVSPDHLLDSPAGRNVLLKLLRTATAEVEALDGETDAA